jgi:hypothetical protein
VDTNLIACTDDDVRATEEVGHGTRVRGEEAFLRLRYTVSAPVDLHEAREFALGGDMSTVLQR